MRSPTYSRSIFVLALILSFVFGAARVRAGTTGGISGSVTDASTGQPLAGARVTVASPAQTTAATTDAAGKFAILSLAPDTYTLSVEKTGYDGYTSTGISIFADQTQQVNVRSAKTLRTIGTTRSRSNSELVRPGTVTDVYSVNAATQARVTGLGGGGSVDQAYSALATVPGVFVPSANNGWSQAAGVVIRGGTHTQVGYEFDGVPVNVGYSFFPGSNLSTLGQQELQAYTGSAPADAQSQGLSGFINQVIKTGTYPGFVNADVGLGSPFYHKFSFEIGGATANRNFTYYAGVLGANQAFKIVDNFDGTGYSYPYGTVYGATTCPGGATAANYAACYKASTPGGLGVGPAGYQYLPPSYNNPAYQQDRENVVNLHLAIPQGKNGIKDDIQLLYDTGGLTTFYNTAQTDLPAGIITQPLTYTDSHIYTGALGAPLPANYASLVKKYYFPSELNGTFGSGLIPPGLRDSQQANQAITKIQYQHNIGTSGYARVFAYTLYSNRFDNSPNSAAFYGGQPPDYSVWTHTSGYAAEFARQLSSNNELQAALSYTHAPSVRDNSTTWATSAKAPFAVAVDASNPNSGVCYAVAGGAATPASCQPSDKQASFVTYNDALKGTAPAALGGTRCGSGPCEYYTVENGFGGNFNAVTQNVYAASLSDQWKPTSRLTLDGGLKYHDYLYTGGKTNYGTRPFWFNAFNNDYCVNSAPGNAPVTKKSLGIAVTAACATVARAGVSYVSPTLTNAPADYSYGELEPRIGFTYSLGPNDVVRGSYGKYTQPTETGFEQYDTNQQNLPAYLGSHFYSLGFTTPGHAIPPQESFNTDFSFEHAFRGTDMSFKATPFYRATRNELTEFFIDPAKQITSGLAVGSLRTSGIEFEFRKGSFDRNGLSALLAYTYTTARINYATLPNGGTILSPINNDIKTYNGYTSFCSTHPADGRCGPTNASNGSGKAAACFTAAGAPDPGCGAGSIANPYWNAPAQSLLDPNGSYWPTDPVVATTALGVNGYTVPHVATFVLNYRHDKFAITPSLQFQAGQRYGAPEANAGIDPGAGCAPLAGATTAGDPRYPYGAAGGAPYDAVTCNAALNAIPNTYTKQFDPIGAFVSPSQLLGGMTLSYDLAKRVGLKVTLANVVNQCFGGSQTAWTRGTGSRLVCSYESGEVSRNFAPTGNAYNPGSRFEPFGQYPYFAYLGPYTMGVVNPSAPLSIFADLNVKI